MSNPIPYTYNKALTDVQYTLSGGLFQPDHAYLLEKLFELKKMDSLTSQEKEKILEPMIKSLSSLDQEGLDALLGKTSATATKYFIEVVEALLQRNYSIYHRSPYKDLLAFQAAVNILHHEMLSSKIGNIVERTLFPLAVWSNSPGPYTIYLNSNPSQKVFYELAHSPVAIVKLPEKLRNGGVVAWSSIGHEVGGHSFLRSFPDLIDELKKELLASLNDLPQEFFEGQVEIKKKMIEYWSVCIEELASDVLGILNLGPAFGIGLALYLKGKSQNIQMDTRGVLHSNATPPIRVVRLQSDSFAQGNLYLEKLNKDLKFPNSGYFGVHREGNKSSEVSFEKLFIPPGKHPLDILRIFAVSEIIRLLDIDDKNFYTEQLEKLIQVELDTLNGGVIKFKELISENSKLKSNLITISIENARRVAGNAAKAVATSSLDVFEGKTLLDLISWGVVDEGIVEDIRTQFTKKPVELSRPDFALHDQLVGRHILAASILQSVEGKSKIERVFNQMKHWLRDEAKKTTPMEILFDSSDSETSKETLNDDDTARKSTASPPHVVPNTE